MDAAERCPSVRDLETTGPNRPLESGHAKRGSRCSPQRLHIALCGGGVLGAEVGRFDPAKALRILSTSKDYARQTLIQSAFMIRTGLLPVADCQSCFVCSQASRSALPSHLRPHASIHADPAMVSACRPSEFGFLRAHTGVLKPVVHWTSHV